MSSWLGWGRMAWMHGVCGEYPTSPSEATWPGLYDAVTSNPDTLRRRRIFRRMDSVCDSGRSGPVMRCHEACWARPMMMSGPGVRTCLRVLLLTPDSRHSCTVPPGYAPVEWLIVGRSGSNCAFFSKVYRSHGPAFGGADKLGAQVHGPEGVSELQSLVLVSGRGKS